MSEEIDALRAMLRATLAQLTTAREWLRANAKHTHDCEIVKGECTCGLDLLLRDSQG